MSEAQQQADNIHSDQAGNVSNSANIDHALSRFKLKTTEPVQLQGKAVDVLKRFRQHEDIAAIPVVNGQMQPIGLITRRKTLAVFGHKYSYELNSRKTVKILMDEQPLILDAQSDIEAISRAMTERDELRAFDPAIMTTNGQYCGLLSVITLLKRITDIRIELAFDSNPLSRLPGNNSINREIDKRLQQGQPFMLVYADLDNFKAFNDHYGYERGDRVIQLVARVFNAAAMPHDFIGHVGGDDFVMLLHPDNWRQQVESALDIFSIESALMYNTDERQRGYIIAEGRQGQSMHFPLMSLSMAVVPCTDHAYPSHVAVSEIASEVKHLAKKQSGNSIVVNRRMPERVTTTHYPRITIVGISHCTE